jgi:hypothetical protein
MTIIRDHATDARRRSLEDYQRRERADDRAIWALLALVLVVGLVLLALVALHAHRGSGVGR